MNNHLIKFISTINGYSNLGCTCSKINECYREFKNSIGIGIIPSNRNCTDNLYFNPMIDKDRIYYVLDSYIIDSDPNKSRIAYLLYDFSLCRKIFFYKSFQDKVIRI